MFYFTKTEENGKGERYKGTHTLNYYITVEVTTRLFPSQHSAINRMLLRGSSVRFQNCGIKFVNITGNSLLELIGNRLNM